MARKFPELKGRMTPEARAKAEALYEQHVRDLPLNELRRARELAQVQLAESMGISQAAVSKIENHADVYVSTLRHFVEAMGGRWRSERFFPTDTTRCKSGFAFSINRQHQK